MSAKAYAKKPRLGNILGEGSVALTLSIPCHAHSGFQEMLTNIPLQEQQDHNRSP